MCQVTKICFDIQINKNMCHYWNDFDKFTWNEFGFKSDRPLLIGNCCMIKLFTMCVLSWCGALIFTMIIIEEVCCFGQKHSY